MCVCVTQIEPLRCVRPQRETDKRCVCVYFALLVNIFCVCVCVWPRNVLLWLCIHIHAYNCKYEHILCCLLWRYLKLSLVMLLLKQNSGLIREA